MAAIYSIVGATVPHDWQQRPFRAPHHTASAAALVGGGAVPRPGEISLAHGGVLFLDELPEFQRQVLEVLREPLESGEIQLSRVRAQTRYPARFQLIAAMNPCPCGYYGHDDQRCRCTPDQIRRYRGRISGPLLDRIDLHVPVTAIAPTELRSAATGEASATIQSRTIAAQKTALDRQGCANADLTAPQIDQVCVLGDTEHQYMEAAVRKLGLSTRAYHRVLKVARTLADMAGEPNIQRPQLAEAISYRALDRGV
ncbi:ATP-binding protein [Gilvimarinus sp. SDUM040013]|uniref:ATP-binding protein n=1 Tax=Gilvimarinus gilvus TaxID=3058038 RepID=A0ABU4S3D2_9GAMM|nr:ATP-binding protein [Gilvimarinus sp. SDUM040013]MDO3388112.1 ATP-binding protein [Gilvimarinus sp. SDUM040013]MDX6850313.1 ATP-binding protein [Gilvimarinus sp. SDUM040013]